MAWASRCASRPELATPTPAPLFQKIFAGLLVVAGCLWFVVAAALQYPVIALVGIPYFGVAWWVVSVRSHLATLIACIVGTLLLMPWLLMNTLTLPMK